jgi:hypothetical protein
VFAVFWFEYAFMLGPRDFECSAWISANGCYGSSLVPSGSSSTAPEEVVADRPIHGALRAIPILSAGKIFYHLKSFAVRLGPTRESMIPALRADFEDRTLRDVIDARTQGPR